MNIFFQAYFAQEGFPPLKVQYFFLQGVPPLKKKAQCILQRRSSQQQQQQQQPKDHAGHNLYFANEFHP